MSDLQFPVTDFAEIDALAKTLNGACQGKSVAAGLQALIAVMMLIAFLPGMTQGIRNILIDTLKRCIRKLEKGS